MITMDLTDEPEELPVPEPDTASKIEILSKVPKSPIATCKQDVTIKIEEPRVIDMLSGKVLDSNVGSSWIGVEGAEVELVNPTGRFNSTTSNTGEVLFTDVPCGIYSLFLSQDQLIFEILSDTTININHNNIDLNIFTKRKIQTIEMFRLGTQYLAAIGLAEGNGDDTYGHYWTKIFDTVDDYNNENARESYGWWPQADTIGAEGTRKSQITDTIKGVPGELNGISYGGASSRDPYHDKLRNYPNLEEVFQPYVGGGKGANHYKTVVANKAKYFEDDISDRWNWFGNNTGWHCKTFQRYLMRQASLWKRMSAHLWSRGWSVNT